MSSKALTKAELRLLRYPPSPESWVCGECTMVNSGSYKKCSWCRKKKPKRPRLLWPSYVRACTKVNVDPAERKRYPPLAASGGKPRRRFKT